ncbi:MAG: aspartate aminotransferase family protein [Chloroflexi bacterium]|nr:aspartate aminotransferase family protein [Chloroflexota bacterium]
MTDWPAVEKEYYLFTVNRLPATYVRGEGARLWDDRGKEYLDFVAGWAVNSLGHCPPAVVEAITRQARTLLQVSNHYYSIPQLELARILVDNSCLDKVFVCNSGAEACEGAVKLARRYGALHRGGAWKVITANNSFHGRTLMMTAATGQEKFHKPFHPIPEGFINVEYNNVDAVKSATSKETCAVMLEPLQGEGGVNVPSPEYLKAVRAWCDETGMLLILDEVQTGIGRLGTLFGYESFGVEPDIMALAKGLGSGVPVGAFMAKNKANVFEGGQHGSTFGGNPLTSAAAHAVVKYVIENNVCENVKQVGSYLLGRLRQLADSHSIVTEARGMGLLQAVEFDREVGMDVTRACLEAGLLVNPVKPNAIRIMPPLIITKADVDEAVEKLDSVLRKL